MKMNFAGFVGCVVLGHYTNKAAAEYSSDEILGSAFVVSPEKGIFLSCNHVIPEKLRKRDVFMVLLNEKMEPSSKLVDLDSIQRWEDKDLIAFRVHDYKNDPPGGLRKYPFKLDLLPLATQVTALGLPPNHMLPDDEKARHPVIRSMTGFTVTDYADEMEVDFSLIRGMSGGPVVHGGRSIVGVSYFNRQYGLDLVQTENVEVSEQGKPTRVEKGEYREFKTLGVFYKASAFQPWLSGLI